MQFQFFLINAESLDFCQFADLHRDWAVFDARTLLSLSILQFGAKKALQAQAEGKMKADHICAELKTDMFPTRSISAAMSSFGPSKDTKAAVLATFTDHALPEELSGHEIHMSRLSEFRDAGMVSALYSLKKVPESEWENRVLTALATRDVMKA
ncbi:CGI-121/TPRKB [Carpediemonas membranifera]|uniref:CGI-121/TPRKB n=1 Tax=Carpediemonas membranifera TaxID=201153 RepID=A0A8J6AQC7_9EUKA|nr:CGI-121/TPRKB [Carpediemonas membranifera]|eukprot:KAG9390853.1 CGI-121/TPRKB [Carpediemonas membranifera]